jgi:hypothetical protein
MPRYHLFTLIAALLPTTALASASVAAAGDMGGGGFNDLLIGEPYLGYLGGIYLIQGRGW